MKVPKKCWYIFLVNISIFLIPTIVIIVLMMLNTAQIMLFHYKIGIKVFSFHSSNFAKSVYPGNVAIIMHQQVIGNKAQHEHPIHAIHLTQSKEIQVDSWEHKTPLHKYFIPKIQHCNDSKKQKKQFVMYAYPLGNQTSLLGN